MAFRISIAIISTNADFLKRAESLGPLFNADILNFKTADEFVENDKAKEVRFALIDGIAIPNVNDVVGMVQAVHFTASTAGIGVVVGKKVAAETAVFIKKSGASVVILENEYIENSKIEFVVARYLNGDWVAIKTADLMKDKPVRFTLYHMMPLNGKFLAVAQPQQILDSEKLQKFGSVGEMYIKREDIPEFTKYVSENVDQSAESLKRRCRAVYMQMVEYYKDLTLLLTDQSEASSFNQGKELYQKIYQMTSELVASLGAVGEAWDIVNNSDVNDPTAIGRASAVASYAGLFSLELSIGKPEDVITSALIADIGLLDLSPQAVALLKAGQVDKMSEVDMNIYNYHPVVSLNKALARKVPIPENIKNIIQTTHENVTQTGFPNKPLKDRIPYESFLIQFAEKLDRRMLVSFGKARISPKEARLELLQNELSVTSQVYPLDFAMKLKAILV